MSFDPVFPVEIFDMIIDYAVDTVPQCDYSYLQKKQVQHHQCQYRKCISHESLSHHQDLLNFSQVSRYFRQKVLRKLWSTVLVRRTNLKSLNNFIWSTPNYEDVYLKYVQTILFESTYRSPLPYAIKWFSRDEEQPFGIRVKCVSSQCAWAVKQAIYWIQNRNLQHMDFVDLGSSFANEFYQPSNLFPFWLCVSKHNVFFTHLRERLTFAKTEDAENGILNYLNRQIPLNRGRHGRYSNICRIIANDQFLLEQVKTLCENGWKLPQSSTLQRRFDKHSEDGCVHM